MQKEKTSQEELINKGILLRKDKFSSSKGIFHAVYRGQLTEIVKKFNDLAALTDPNNDTVQRESKNDIV